jgi:hypothetical protein
MKQSFYLYIYDEYCLATWITTTEEIHLLALDLQSISAVHGLGIWLAETEDIRVGALGLQPISDECVPAPTEEIRLLALTVNRNFKYKIQCFQ